MWLKYRHKFADSPGDWEWLNIHNDNDIEGIVAYLKHEWTWSDHYRGIDFELHEIPTLEVLNKEIELISATIASLSNSRDELEKLASKLIRSKAEENISLIDLSLDPGISFCKGTIK